MGINDIAQPSVENEEARNILKELGEPLLAWYNLNARILPWREDATPYRVWISEVMLQQTRVEAVKSYFERFMKALPTIQSLAEIEEDSLLKLWEGLGYYSRARNIKKAAKIVVEEYGGEFPSDYDQLMKLPGIGSYTAGAISSIAFGRPVPAVDGNVLRVISRVLASEEDITSQSVKRKVEDELRATMPQIKAGAFNQAIMEIGAMVCVPNGMAKCEICPLNQLCKANILGIVMELPKKTPKKPRTIEEKTILVIKSGDKVALRKRNNKGILAGLYEFPNIDGHLSEKEVLYLVKQMSLSAIRIQKLEDSKHIFTHKEWHMIGYVVKVEDLEQTVELDRAVKLEQAIGLVNVEEKQYLEENNSIFKDCFFVEPAEMEDRYPIPTAFQRYTKYINIILGNDKFKHSEY